MWFCSSLSDQSVNDSHSSAVEQWTVHHEFANIASASTFFFDGKWGIINLDLFYMLFFVWELWFIGYLLLHIVPPQNHILHTPQISFLDSIEKHYLLF